MYVCVYIYIYIIIERERERDIIGGLGRAGELQPARRQELPRLPL